MVHSIIVKALGKTTSTLNCSSDEALTFSLSSIRG